MTYNNTSRTSIARFMERKQQQHAWLQGSKEKVVKTVLVSLEKDTLHDRAI